jgi:hypothetical protein
VQTFVYLFGQPGSGKTTLMREVCRRGMMLYDAEKPIKHRGYAWEGGMFSALGAEAWPFGGTDTLAYDAVAKCSRWLPALQKCKAGGLVFAEGDRLANLRFFGEVEKRYRLLAFYLSCDDALAGARRRLRASRHGLAAQSETWVRGRITKHDNLAMQYPGTYRLDSCLGADVLAQRVWWEVLQLENPNGETRAGS